MSLGRPGGGRCGGGALDAEDGAVAGDALEEGLDVGKGSHVGGLFLDPDNFGGGGMLIQCSLELGFREGVELFEEDDADRVVFALGALDAQVVADLAAADEQAVGVGDGVVGENVLEVVEREVGDRGHGVGVTQHGFRGEDDEGLAPFTHGLAAQEVEELRGGGGLGDLNIVLRGQLEIAFDAGAGVLGSLTFVAVGEEHH